MSSMGGWLDRGRVLNMERCLIMSGFSTFISIEGCITSLALTERFTSTSVVKRQTN